MRQARRLIVAVAVTATGCAVPRSRMEDCARRTQEVQAENGQLRDLVLQLRNRNRDMAQRAVEDARRLQAQESSLRRLERSVAAYQQERDQLAAAFDQIRRQVQAAAAESPDARVGRGEPPGASPAR